MNNSKTINALKKALLVAMRGGKYDVPAETEKRFMQLIGESLMNTDLEPYIRDINFIINSYMALLDKLY